MSIAFQKIKRTIWITLIFIPGWIHAQTDSLLEIASLDKVVEYALVHQAVVQQAIVDEEITNKVIKGKLADWYPQINFTYNYQRFIDLQVAV